MSMIKTRLALACAIALSSSVHGVIADIKSDADTLLNWGEMNYPQILAGSSQTQQLDAWYFRFYPLTNAYVGVNGDDKGVYVLYGTPSPSSKPIYVDSVANLLAKLPASGAEPTPVPLVIDTPLPPPSVVVKSEVACDADAAPAGVSYTQNGNTVAISTNGQCIATPKTDMCLPKQSTASGLSVVKQLNLKTYSLNGLNFADPAMAAIMDPQIKSYGSIKTCVKNAPQEVANLTLNLDGCFDVTEQVKGFPSIPGLFTVKPPVTMQMQGDLTNTIVADCFKTDATMITDAVTKEVWDWNKSKNAFVKR